MDLFVRPKVTKHMFGCWLLWCGWLRSMRALMIVVLVIVGFTTSLLGAVDGDFESHWRDGQAELSGYEWSVTRYGQQRIGQAVMIFVVEPFSKSQKVKLDHPSIAASDSFEAMKLNLVRDFQTGIYDYNTMVSVFTDTMDFMPVKTSFTSAEWCGHVYEELLFGPKRIKELYFSYFEGESSSRMLRSKKGGVTEDGLFILLRDLRDDFLEPGEKRVLPFLAGSFYRRLTHRRLEWSTCEIERLAEFKTIEVPAGEFSVVVYSVKTGHRIGRFFIEKPYPHRIIRWQWTAPKDVNAEGSETGELTGTVRSPYWQLNGNGHEDHLTQLGLKYGRRD